MKEEIKRCPFCDGSAGARTRGTEACFPKNADYDWRDCVGAGYEIEAWNARI